MNKNKIIPFLWAVLFLVICQITAIIHMTVKANAEEIMETIKLPKPCLKGMLSLEEAIQKRRSVRKYSEKKLTLNEISQLCWACQGITSRQGFRAAPSAGAIYPLKLYVLTNDGVYHYNPESHALTKISDKDKKAALAQACFGQRFVQEAPINLVICAVYDKITPRYGQRGIRYADIEVGHAAQNVHLEAVALGLSSVPVGAFGDDAVSKVLELPKHEKPVYVIPIGHRKGG